ncbi:MAG: hypothetical protein ACR2KC_07110 [Acidimicrobiales bacterium]
MSRTWNAGSPIEDYLDRVFDASGGMSARVVRHLLAETEAHLRDAATEAIAGGADRYQAEAEAVARFGPVEALLSAEATAEQVPLRALVRPAVATSLLIGGLGGLAMGLSALLTALVGLLAGSTSIVDISPSTHLASSDCARWLSQNHSAHSCYQAALQDWATETVANRAALGVVGVLALIAYARLRRHWSARQLRYQMPRAPVDAAAFLLFAGAGVWLTGLGIDSVISNAGRGAGASFGTAPALLALGMAFGWRLLADLRKAQPVAQ